MFLSRNPFQNLKVLKLKIWTSQNIGVATICNAWIGKWVVILISQMSMDCPMNNNTDTSCPLALQRCPSCIAGIAIRQVAHSVSVKIWKVAPDSSICGMFAGPCSTVRGLSHATARLKQNKNWPGFLFFKCYFWKVLYIMKKAFEYNRSFWVPNQLRVHTAILHNYN